MRLYKYMRAVDVTICSKKVDCKECPKEKISDRLRKMLEQSRIYLSDPETFNDPFDGYFSIQFKTEQDKVDAKQALEEVRGQLEKEGNLQKERVEMLGKNLFTQIPLANFRVSCFSEDNKNDLMWAHYADQHRGVCLVYEIDNVDEMFIRENNCLVFAEENQGKNDNYGCFGGNSTLLLARIDYSKNKEFLKVSSGRIESDYNVERAIYTKSKCWEYEHEIRLVAELPFGYTFGDDTYFCKVNKSALREVRFGIRLEDKYKEEIQKIIENSGYNEVVFKTAVINIDDFSINYEKI